MELNKCGWLVMGLAMIILSCSGNDKKEKVVDEDFYGDHRVAENTAEPKERETSHPVNRAHYHTVEIRQMKFVPAELVVEDGDTVVWVNNDITVHDVTEQPSDAWSSGELPVGATWMMIAEESAEYYCSIHVVMKGKLLVKGQPPSQ